MSADFSKFLHVSAEAIERPKPLPLGHYFATIKSYKTAERDFDKANGGPKTPVVELSFAITSPDTDVEDFDPAMLKGAPPTKDYKLPDQMYMIRELAEKACDLPVKGLEFIDVLDALKGQEVKVFNEPRPGREEGEFFTNIKRVLSAHG